MRQVHEKEHDLSNRGAVDMLRRIRYLANTELVKEFDDAAVRLRMIALILESATAKAILAVEEKYDVSK
jgi:hypothetical protein